MAKVIHPENYVSVVTASARQVELVQLASAAAASQQTSRPAARIAEIQSRLAQANADFLQRRYRAAVDGYKLAQGIIYSLLNSRFQPSQALRPELVLPVSEALLGQIYLVTVVALIVSNLRPRAAAAQRAPRPPPP